MDGATVPSELIGCWRRAWIRFADGTYDDTTQVIWLQLDSRMADIRIPASRPDLSRRGGFDDCSLDELRQLADSDSSSGITRCTDIVTDADGVRRATAEWFTRGIGINFQPVSVFPEPGLLEWNDDGNVLIERAPSGAYVEEWHLMPGTCGPSGHRVLDDGRELYRAGEVAVVVRDRAVPVPRLARLEALVLECGDDRSAIETLIDCEFSFIERIAGRGDRGTDETHVVTMSTLPWRQGDVVDVDL